MARLEDYPGAPPGAYVCREGWLVYRDEAWTLDEWHSPDTSIYRKPTGRRPGRPRKGDITDANDREVSSAARAT